MATLYERLGGDYAVKEAIDRFFKEILLCRDLLPFFENISISALMAHHFKLLKVIFGAEQEKPDPEEYYDFMMATHVRLFRDYGLDATHFDLAIECFVRGLQSLDVDKDLIDECVAILGTTRIVFEHGARIAAHEKTYNAEQLSMLPTATFKNIDSSEPTVLPDPAQINIPAWLPETLRHCSANDDVRSWTCDLINRFGVDGDKVIADTFMDMPYMNHHVYAAAMMQLAFLPEGGDTVNLLPIVLYPRGPDKPSLCAGLWERMIEQFEHTCDYMMMESDFSKEAIGKLQSYTKIFPKGEIKVVGGIMTPHVLRHVVHKFDVSLVNKHHRRGSSPDSVTAAESVASEGGKSRRSKSGNSKSGKRSVWRRLLGWTKVH